ncbi:phospholipase A2 inhibitor and Ly6/PLAUR domain-containing protein-like [Ranitomeya imitator]|uniref:phospholipase A2 inhibitor and Ly6/PLAUR domain-containing protein-like n=1 Tax=Ranitomeya imitator TaxID=111125 RepID=UPI0037E8AE60
MRGPVVTACVVCLLMAAACCLRCVIYHHPVFQTFFNEKLGTEETCASEYDVCLLVFYVSQKRSENKVNGFRFHRNCGNSFQCNLNGSFTTVSHYVKYSITCCGTDSCLPPLPVLPEVDLKKNGVACPACYVDNDHNVCIPKSTMECAGEETFCVFTNETLLEKSNVYSFGCGTKSVIQKNGNLHNLLSMYSSINVTNTPPIPGLKPGGDSEASSDWAPDIMGYNTASQPRGEPVPTSRDLAILMDSDIGLGPGQMVVSFDHYSSI